MDVPAHSRIAAGSLIRALRVSSRTLGWAVCPAPLLEARGSQNMVAAIADGTDVWAVVPASPPLRLTIRACLDDQCRECGPGLPLRVRRRAVDVPLCRPSPAAELIHGEGDCGSLSRTLTLAARVLFRHEADEARTRPLLLAGSIGHYPSDELLHGLAAFGRRSGQKNLRSPSSLLLSYPT